MRVELNAVLNDHFIDKSYICIDRSACGVFGIAKHPDRDTRVGTSPATRADLKTSVSAGRVSRPESPRTLRFMCKVT